MIVLYILLGLFSLLFALTLLPLTVQASYREDKLELELWVGGVKIPLPQKEKTEKKQPQAAASAPETGRKEKKKARRFSKWNEMVPLLQKALSGGVKALGILFAHLSIPSLTLSITVGGERAADTALLYGKLHAGAGALFGFLFRFRRLEKLLVSITPDFNRKQTCYEGSVILRIQLLQLLRAAFAAAGALLSYFIKNQLGNRSEKPDQSPTEKGGQHSMSHPIEGLMNTAMQKIKEMVDVNTIIGDPIHVSDSITIIPVSKVSFGFASGGSDLPSKQPKELFGGGSGAGVSIDPLAFLVINGDQVQLLQYSAPSGSADRAVSLVPDLIDKVSSLFSKGKKEEPAQPTVQPAQTVAAAPEE